MDNSGSMGERPGRIVPGTLGSYDVGAGNSLNASGNVRSICRAGFTAYFNQFNATFGTNFVFTTNQINTSCIDFEGAFGENRINALRFSATALTDALMNPNPNGNRIALATWDLFAVRNQNFTSNANSVKSFLNVMYGRGQTNSTIGLQQAQTLAGGFRTGKARAVILLTDGYNNLGASVFAQAVSDQATLNANSLALCNRFKSQGVIVYTIGFGRDLADTTNPLNVAADQFLSDCATGPNGGSKPNLNSFYFRAPDATSLAASFQAIAGSLKKVQILE